MNLISLCSGSGGNISLLRHKNTLILIDAGKSAKQILTYLKELHLTLENISAILITHEHGDHIKGLKVLLKNHPIPVFGPQKSLISLKEQNLLSPLTPLVPLSQLPFTLGEILITPIPTPHDSVSSLGYRFDYHQESIALITDLGEINSSILEKLKGVSHLMIEANYDENLLLFSSYPQSIKQRIKSSVGHLSNTDCALCLEYLVNHGLKNIMLAHLSKENNHPDLAFQTIKSHLQTLGCWENITLIVAHPQYPTSFLS